MTREEGQVIETGIPNEQGYKRLIKIRMDHTGEEFTRYPWPHESERPPGDETRVFIIPTQDIPPDLVDYATENSLSIARDPCGSTDARYKLFCTACYEIVVIKDTTVEEADLKFADNWFDQGKPEITNCDRALVCGCPDVEYSDIEELRHYA